MSIIFRIGKLFQWLLIAIIPFAAGWFLCLHMMGGKYGNSVQRFFQRPEIIEREVVVEKYYPVIVSDDSKVLMVNQAYRDALNKIVALDQNDPCGQCDNDSYIYNASLYAKEALEIVNKIAEK